MKRELTPQDLDGFQASFTPPVSGAYATTLNFPQPIDVEEVRDLVNGTTRGGDAGARFDFVWQVLDGGKPVTGGTGQQGATGILDTGSGGHRLYSIEFKAGPAMAPVIRAKPLLEIVRVSAIRQ